MQTPNPCISANPGKANHRSLSRANGTRARHAKREPRSGLSELRLVGGYSIELENINRTCSPYEPDPWLRRTRLAAIPANRRTASSMYHEVDRRGQSRIPMPDFADDRVVRGWLRLPPAIYRSNIALTQVEHHAFPLPYIARLPTIRLEDAPRIQQVVSEWHSDASTHGEYRQGQAKPLHCSHGGSTAWRCSNLSIVNKRASAAQTPFSPCAPPLSSTYSISTRRSLEGLLRQFREVHAQDCQFEPDGGRSRRIASPQAPRFAHLKETFSAYGEFAFVAR